MCLYIDRFNPPYEGLIRKVMARCSETGISLSAAASCIDHLKGFGLSENDSCDMAMVLGGDGTILRGLGFFKNLNVPVLGINAGQLGFLASAEKTGVVEAIERVARGEYIIETTPVLRGEMPTDKALTAVNDFSVNRSMIGGILHFDLFVGDARVASIAGDGVVVSTPFGSTAYSLSCGGPILDPGLPAMLVVAICPHSLSLRPLVVPDDQVISIRIGQLRSTGPVVSADGVPSGTLKTGEILRITKGTGSCMTVRFADEPGYYSRLGLKLGWGVRG
ncbi:MAG: hypothetical protein AVO35_05440 [Candidatus Aegiribacteria sp. MLS_C]|nr:MAG: hypothetical protein AVO35_05440 [Candidatus Aegiribacteria sp. MLS_C]